MPTVSSRVGPLAGGMLDDDAWDADGRWGCRVDGVPAAGRWWQEAEATSVCVALCVMDMNASPLALATRGRGSPFYRPALGQQQQPVHPRSSAAWGLLKRSKISAGGRVSLLAFYAEQNLSKVSILYTWMHGPMRVESHCTGKKRTPTSGRFVHLIDFLQYIT
jgi:hypothetical protein